jgi:hypothetical protein
MTIAAANRPDHPETLFATPEIVAERRADGSILLKSATPLQPSARCVGDWLEHWARQTPDRIFLGERSSVDAPWTILTYKDALRQVRSVAAWILAQGLSAERPLVVLSDNSIESRAVGAGGDACRRAHCGDLAGLFADVEGLRQAQEHDRFARSRRDLCLTPQAVRAGAYGDRTAAFGQDCAW